MRTFSLECTALSGTNKVGKLEPDDNGYYPVVLGGFDIPNPVGDFYPYEGAKHLFEESSILMRNIESGNLYGEWGHPKRLPGETLSSYIKRCSRVEESNIAFHIKKVTINFGEVKDKEGNNVVSIIGWVKGSGPRASEFDRMMANPDQNVCFSIRATSEDVPNQRGTMDRNLSSIITWDMVIFGGLEVAQKYKSPALESFDSVSFDEEVLYSIRRDIYSGGGIAMEDSGCLDMLAETLKSKPRVKRNINKDFLKRRLPSSSW